MDIKKILVSQPKPSSDKSPYYDIARKYNVDIVFRPMIKVESLSAKEFRQQKINLADYTAVIFTSRTAVDNFFRLCEETRFHVPDTMRYFCTTEPVALYLQKYIVYRKRKISFGTSGHIDDPTFLAAVQKNVKEKFLLPISDVQANETFQPLIDNKINFTKAVMYRTVSNDFTPDEHFDYDLIIFFSPAGIQSLMKNFPDFAKDGQKTCIGAFGAATVQSVKDAGLRLDLEAPTPKTPSMTAALDAFLEQRCES